MPPQRCPPSPGSNVVVGGVWNPWAQGWLALLALGKLPRQGSCRGRGGRPGKGLAGGVHLAPLLFYASGLGVALFVLCLGFPPASLLCLVKCGHGRGSNCPCTSKGVQKRALLLFTDTEGVGDACILSQIIEIIINFGRLLECITWPFARPNLRGTRKIILGLLFLLIFLFL